MPSPDDIRDFLRRNNIKFWADQGDFSCKIGQTNYYMFVQIGGDELTLSTFDMQGDIFIKTAAQNLEEFQAHLIWVRKYLLGQHQV